MRRLLLALLVVLAPAPMAGQAADAPRIVNGTVDVRGRKDHTIRSGVNGAEQCRGARERRQQSEGASHGWEWQTAPTKSDAHGTCKPG